MQNENIICESKKNCWDAHEYKRRLKIISRRLKIWHTGKGILISAEITHKEFRTMFKNVMSKTKFNKLNKQLEKFKAKKIEMKKTIRKRLIKT